MTTPGRDAKPDSAAGADATAGVRVRDNLVLSLFPGIDLLGRGFEREGYCVVRGPDLIYGQDVRFFAPASHIFSGIIGGPPCQDFSSLRRCEPSGDGLAMLNEFARVVAGARPFWFLMENVVGVPDVRIEGYHVQRLNVAATECGCRQRRLRAIQFGQLSHEGVWKIPEQHPLVIARPPAGRGQSRTALASEGRRAGRRGWAEFCRLQGLPGDFDLPGMTRAGKYRAVGNGVPLPMARTLARAVTAWAVTETVQRACVCGCGRPVRSGKTQATDACRKRMERARRDAGGVAVPGPVTAGIEPSQMELA